VSCENSHILAIRSDGKLFTWGDNAGGQLGDGTTTRKSIPTQIGNNNWSVVSSGGSHSLAIPLGNLWSQVGSDINGEASQDYSGWSVSSNGAGDVIAIGAPYNNGNGIDSGHVRVYAWNGTSWAQRGTDINGEAASDYSGVSISLNNDGTIVAIGAPQNDGGGSNSGHVRVYVWNGTSWIQRGTDINGEAAGDQSGTSVSISDDGAVVAIGAPYNDGNGSDSGHVRVYAWNGTSWAQRGTDINGEAAGDQSGHYVSLS
jgi:hypothetical protein